jgi:cytochrome d ubiquinol oxidase subunit I
MHYPWWYVPHVTAPMLIGIIATIHVIVSHYAVGGGLFLALEAQFAHRTGNRAYLDYLHRHAWFFVLLTVVFGAITGVGIWWTIGLASPLATEVLIHTFVFGWAMEYVFFVLEIASAFIFLYGWDRLPAKTHVIIGWIYALSAWASLVLITGITAFMLNPGRWVETGGFWTGFFNPQFVPQTLARTGGSLLLASLYVYLHASICAKESSLRELIAKRSARPALLGSVLVAVGCGLWYVYLPESAKLALSRAASLNIFIALLFAVTVLVFVMFTIGPHRRPGWLTPGFGILFLSLGVIAVTAGEFVREAVRKPYIIYNVVLGNQILAGRVPAVREAGFLESGVWTRELVRTRYPKAVDAQGHIDEAALLRLSAADRRALGEVLFQHQCNDCHAIESGLSAVQALTRGWTAATTAELVRHPERKQFFMPPWSGTEEEAQLLTEWLESIQLPFPPGMYFGEGSPEIVGTARAEEVQP